MEQTAFVTPGSERAKLREQKLGLLIIALLALDFFTLLVLTIVFRKELIVAAFYGYLLIGANVALVLIVVAFQPHGLKDFLFYVKADMESKGSWGRVRWIWHFGFLSPLVNGLNWPGFLLVVRVSQSSVRKTQQQSGDASARWPPTSGRTVNPSTRSYLWWK